MSVNIIIYYNSDIITIVVRGFFYFCFGYRFTPVLGKQQGASGNESLRTRSLTLPSRNVHHQQLDVGLHSVQLLPTIVAGVLCVTDF